MNTAIVYTRGELGIAAPLVTVEAHLANGIPKLHLVGLPEKVVKESKDRVRCAILNSHFSFPNRIITVNLAPAELPKEGGRFDLAIAISILAASQQIPHLPLDGLEIAGELGLTGHVRPILGILPFAVQTRAAKKILILPKENIADVQLLDDLKIIAAESLAGVCHSIMQNAHERISSSTTLHTTSHALDFSEVKGQQHAKRALEISAAGGHNVLMVGPPGTGKTMLASRLPTIMPPLSPEASIEVAAIASISHQKQPSFSWFTPPFRHPHHSASSAALVGGGNPPKPGEISLAHHGVLFLDELPEFNRTSLESLREPLESGKITLARANHHREYPARFQLVAAMNPCPCGHFGDPAKQCQCSTQQIQRYRAKISGPLLDRIDLQLQVLAITRQELLTPTTTTTENSHTIAQRVFATRQRQYQRQQLLNGYLQGRDVEKICAVANSVQDFLFNAIEQLHISNRGIHRVLKVARTIADMENSDTIEISHLSESLSYRLHW